VHVDHTAPGFDEPPPVVERYSEPPPVDWPPESEPAEYAAPQYQASEEDPRRYEGPAYPPADEPSVDEAYNYDEPMDDIGYDAPEDGYPYPYRAADDGRRRRGGSSALPIIGFIVLCALALGVGAVLAGVLGGDGGVGQASASPSATQSAPASEEPTIEPSGAASDEPSATQEPTDGPVTFPDGAVIEVQPCATQDMNFDGCEVDGDVITEPTMWVWIGFDDATGTDTFTLTLQSDGQTVDQQEQVLGSVLDCPGTCSGYLIGAAYRDLEPGEYELEVRRNDDFADSATFTVEG
jgi:hypothetical protein